MKITKMLLLLSMIFSFVACGNLIESQLNADEEEKKQEEDSTTTKNLNDNEKYLYQYVTSIGEISTENITAKYIYDTNEVSDVSEIEDLPAIGQYSDDLLVFYCAKGSDTPSYASLKILCGSDEEEIRLLWWCSDESEQMPIGFSYDGFTVYSHGYEDSREIFGFMACKDGLFTHGTADFENFDQHMSNIEYALANNVTSLNEAIDEGSVDSWQPDNTGYVGDGDGFAGSDGSVIYTSGIFGAFFDGETLITWP